MLKGTMLGLSDLTPVLSALKKYFHRTLSFSPIVTTEYCNCATSLCEARELVLKSCECPSQNRDCGLRSHDKPAVSQSSKYSAYSSPDEGLIKVSVLDTTSENVANSKK